MLCHLSKTHFFKKENIQVLLFLIKDVTKEIDIEEKLQLQAKKSQLGLIKGSIAHELNNPIAGIKTLLDVIDRQTLTEKKGVKELLKQMKDAINQCQNLIKNLLSASYIREDKSHIEKTNDSSKEVTV